MGMTEDDKRNCCLVEIQETEAKYYKTLEDIEKVSVTICVHSVERADICAFLSWLKQWRVGVSFCHFVFVGVSGLWAGSQHGNVSYWRSLLGAQMSQELIDSVIIGSVPTGDADPWGFKYRPAHHRRKDIYT